MPAKKKQPALQKQQQQAIELPVQLVSIIRSEAEADTTLNETVAASQGRHVKELASYVRAVCMRVNLVPSDYNHN